jgi:ribosomal protein L9
VEQVVVAPVRLPLLFIWKFGQYFVELNLHPNVEKIYVFIWKFGQHFVELNLHPSVEKVNQNLCFYLEIWAALR